MQRPDASEHSPFYSTYIDRVPDRPVIEILGEAPAALEALLGELSPDDENYAYAPGKWTVREALGHVVDTERVFSYRALHIARTDSAALPGMDQHVWAGASNAGNRALTALLAEFRGLRTANMELFRSFDEETLDRRGLASDVEISVRAQIYVVAGHELHHRAIFRERYLAGMEAGMEGRSDG